MKRKRDQNLNFASKTTSKKKTQRTSKTPSLSLLPTAQPTVDSYPPLCTSDLLVRCQTKAHLLKHWKRPIKQSRASVLVAKATLLLAEEIRQVLTANSALFSSLYENRKHLGEEIIRALHKKRQKNVEYLLDVYKLVQEKRT